MFWALFFFRVFINDLSALWKILFISLLMTPPSAVPSVIPQIGKQQLLRSLQIWIKSQAGPTRGTCLSIQTNLTLSLCLSERAIWNPPHQFLNNPLEEVLSFKLLGLTICHDLSWESHISNLASKSSCRLGILHCEKSFLGAPELATINKTFISSLMEYCSRLPSGVVLLPHSELDFRCGNQGF